MHQVQDAIVRGGRVVLSDLPFADGQHVQIVISGNDSLPVVPASIHEVRRLLRGGVEHFDEPFEPLIPENDWEMHK
jgi:hypothetical protein